MAKQWMVPRAASRLYTGRQELGERLAQMLLFDPSTPPIQQRTFAIIGVGGTGKSEVCLEIFERSKSINTTFPVSGFHSTFGGHIS